ncbi:hypothetical protein NKG05_01995 [Oerskovia sp. M15]
MARHAWRLKDTPEPTLDELRQLLPEDLLPQGERAAESILDDSLDDDQPTDPTVSPQEEPA